jgi:hypothetical protein
MNSETYFSTKSFLEAQIKELLLPFAFSDRAWARILNNIVDSENIKVNEGQLEVGLERVLTRVNGIKKSYLQRQFTQQATRHVALQLLESENSAQARATDQTNSILELIQSDNEEEGENDDAEEDDAEVERQLRERLKVQFFLMSEKQLLALAQDLLESDRAGTEGLAQNLYDAKQKYAKTKQQNKTYQTVHETLIATVTDDPEEAVQPNLLTQASPELINLIGKIRSLSAKVSAKAEAHPKRTKELLDDEKAPISGNALEPDLKRQKLILKNDPSEILDLVFRSNLSSS